MTKQTKQSLTSLPLSGYRILDLTDEKGLFCGKLLADLGADVIKVEPPGGDLARYIGPFYKDIQNPERSLFWFAYNTSKRGITLNINSERGCIILKRLIRTSDVVLESFKPSYLKNRGLGFEELSHVNPRIIMTSITPFGQEGPYSQYEVSELVVWSMGGYTYLCGNPDGPPVQITCGQAYLHGSAEATVATMIALYRREEIGGGGQHIDVSIQASVAKDLLNAPLYGELQGVELKRAGTYRVGLSAGIRARNLWQCRDGYVSFLIFGGSFGARSNRALVEYMDSEGMAPQFMKEIDWDHLDLSQMTQELMDRMERVIQEFFLKHTKRELFVEAENRRMTVYPVNTIEDIYNDHHLADVGFWQKVDHPELGEKIVYPGGMVRSTQEILRQQTRAPLIGENNKEIYQEELGYSDEELSLFRKEGTI